MESLKTISKSANVQSADFLLLRHYPFGFLLNRSQVAGSASIEKVRTIKSSILHLRSLMEYEGELLLLYNFEEYLARLYNLSVDKDRGREEDYNSELALIVNIDSFSPRSKKIYEKIAVRGRGSLSSKFMAFQVNEMAEMVHLPIGHLKPLPKLLRKRLLNRGIFAVHFPETGRINFVCDIEKLVFNAIIRKEDN